MAVTACLAGCEGLVVCDVPDLQCEMCIVGIGPTALGWRVAKLLVESWSLPEWPSPCGCAVFPNQATQLLHHELPHH